MNAYLDELGNAGIILIKKKDVVTSLLLSYLNVNYSHIGFYYRKYNPIVYKVIILNVIEIIDSVVHEYDLTEYINYEGTSVFYKKLNKNGIGEHYNNCIKKLLVQSTKVPKAENILNFFRMKLNSFRIFNDVLCDIDTSLFGTNRNNDYLLESKYFDSIKELILKSKKTLDNKIYNHYLTVYKTFLEVVVTTPGLDEKIMEIVGTNDLLKNNKFFADELLTNYFYSSQQIFQDIMTGLKNKKLKSVDFIKHLKTMAADFEKLTEYNNNELSDIDTLREDFIFVADTKSRISATNNIKNIIGSVTNDIKNGTVPVIRINKLISNFNTLMKQIDHNYRPLNIIEDDISIYGMIITDENVKDIPIQLKDGDKIMIPMSETNYSRFNKDQLEEMLVLLDIYANGNNKFDQVRANITKEIANK